jgi:hypothetical protein
MGVIKVEVEQSIDGQGRRVFIGEDEKVSVRILLKEDYSHIDPDQRNKQIISDVEAALEAAFDTDDFKDFVDNSGLLYRGREDMD